MMKLSQGTVHRETLLYATYYARAAATGCTCRRRAGQEVSHPTDLLIGIMGSEGSGKSTLIKGLFPASS